MASLTTFDALEGRPVFILKYILMYKCTYCTCIYFTIGATYLKPLNRKYSEVGSTPSPPEGVKVGATLQHNILKVLVQLHTPSEGAVV